MSWPSLKGSSSSHASGLKWIKTDQNGSKWIKMDYLYELAFSERKLFITCIRIGTHGWRIIVKQSNKNADFNTILPIIFTGYSS
jgi:hypothetical protein